ncbi:MAG: type II toxin-antitoxin system HipA family toxin [Acidimicrobiaceae bacterium]|nr:type II toxin-antitoxin system HipA family toxin [Acidimicrobiaceae bacterium]
MTSNHAPPRAYVWVWLPGATEPVVAGLLEPAGDTVVFNYARSYLARDNAISLYEPELPLGKGRIRPFAGLRVAGCISDAGPDAWGQRVIIHRHFGAVGRDRDSIELGLLTYLLESGSDRIGALDFQTSSDTYVPRIGNGTLEELRFAAERLEAGEPFSPSIDGALLHGSSIGGARPKALLEDGDRKLIAKFSSSTDPYPVVKAEAVAMDLARRVGLNVAATEITTSLGRDVLLIDRFDRTAIPGERRMLVSALTLLELDEMAGRYATYFELADMIRKRFISPLETLRELFSRIVFNICVGNTDDHARNHAAFWDGSMLTLSPAYDICPQTRSGGEAAQAMAIGRDGFRLSQLEGCVTAAEAYLLTEAGAREIIDQQLLVINDQWLDAADASHLTEAERNLLWNRQILNPFATDGYTRRVQ